MKTPKPGLPVRGSKSGAPIMALFDLLGRSWAMGILWHLSEGPKTFRELQAYCETISPTSLNMRIKDLRKSHLVERSVDGYTLTILGKELFELISPLGKWAKTKWAKKYHSP